MTCWKFAPEFKIERSASNRYQIGNVRIEASAAWNMARTFNPPDELRGKVVSNAAELLNVPLESLVSPAFRAVTAASYLVLESTEPGLLEVMLTPG